MLKASSHTGGNTNKIDHGVGRGEQKLQDLEHSRTARNKEVRQSRRPQNGRSENASEKQ